MRTPHSACIWVLLPTPDDIHRTAREKNICKYIYFKIFKQESLCQQRPQIAIYFI